MMKFIKRTVHLLIVGPLFLLSCFAALVGIAATLAVGFAAALLCLMAFIIGAFIHAYFKETKGEGTKAQASKDGNAVQGDGVSGNAQQ